MLITTNCAAWPTINSVRNAPITRCKARLWFTKAYVRLVGQNPPTWEGRSHFFAIAARLMRQILVDYARHRAGKRGGGETMLSIDDETMPLQILRHRSVLDPLGWTRKWSEIQLR